jgi:hypothetical protein
MERIFQPRFFLFQLGLSRRADLDHRDATDQFRQALLEVLAIVIRCGLLDLRPEVCDSARNTGYGSCAFDDRCRLFRDRDALRTPQIIERDVFKLHTYVFGDYLPPRQDRDIPHHLLAALAEPRRLDRGTLEHATQCVDH